MWIESTRLEGVVVLVLELVLVSVVLELVLVSVVLVSKVLGIDIHSSKFLFMTEESIIVFLDLSFSTNTSTTNTTLTSTNSSTNTNSTNTNSTNTSSTTTRVIIELFKSQYTELFRTLCTGETTMTRQRGFKGWVGEIKKGFGITFTTTTSTTTTSGTSSTSMNTMTTSMNTFMTNTMTTSMNTYMTNTMTTTSTLKHSHMGLITTTDPLLGFMITLDKCESLDQTSTIVGRVMDGLVGLKKLESMGGRVEVVECGQM